MTDLEKAATAALGLLETIGDNRSMILQTIRRALRDALAAPERVPDDDAKDAARYRWLRDHASSDWLDSGITDDAVDEAINDKSQWRKKP